MNLSSISTIFSMAMLILAAIGIILAVIGGLVRGFKKTLCYLFGNIGAVVIAIFVSRPIATSIYNSFGTQINDLLMSTLPSDITENSVIMGIVFALAMALVSVAVYTLFYFVLYYLMKLVMLIVGKAVTKDDERKHHLFGAILGAVNGILFTICFFAAISGVNMQAKQSLREVASIDVSDITDPDSKLFATVDTARNLYGELKPAFNSSVLQFTYKLGGKVIYDRISVVEYTDSEGKSVKTTLSAEMDVITKTVVAAAPLMDMDTQNITEADAAALRKTEETAAESDLVMTLVSEILGDACTKWSAGSTYLGVEAPGTGSAYGPVLKLVFATYKDADSEDVVQILDFVADVVDILVKYDVINVVASGEGSTDGIAALVGNEAFLTDILTTFYSVDKIRPAISQATNYTIVLICEKLELDPATVVCDPVDMSTVTEEQIAEEAKVLSVALSDALEVAGAMAEGGNVTDISFVTVGEAIEKLGDSIFYGPSSRKLIAAILRSNKFGTAAYIDETMIAKVENGELSISGLFALAESAKKLSGGLDLSDPSSLEAIGDILENMDEDTAEIVSGVIASQLKENAGISDETAAIVEDIMKDVLTSVGESTGEGEADINSAVADAVLGYTQENDLDLSDPATQDALAELMGIFGGDLSGLLGGN